jgi:hypothetical protein
VYGGKLFRVSTGPSQTPDERTHSDEPTKDGDEPIGEPSSGSPQVHRAVRGFLLASSQPASRRKHSVTRPGKHHVTFVRSTAPEPAGSGEPAELEDSRDLFLRGKKKTPGKLRTRGAQGAWGLPQIHGYLVLSLLRETLPLGSFIFLQTTPGLRAEG